MALPVRAPWPPSVHDEGPSLADAAPLRRLRLAARGVLLAVLALVMVGSGLVVLGIETSATGTGGFLIGVALALLPLPVVLAAFRWVDRYEPEPRGLLAFAFFWGATVAALVAAVLNTASAVVVARTAGADAGLATTAVAVAPWVEEGAKGAAILAVFLFRRREFDGIVDGIVLAGFTGVGFAFTENILYFGRAFLAGHQELGLTGGLFAAGVTFVLRGVLAPFAHPLFTTMTGIGLGIAARGRGFPARVLAPLAGYLLAVTLHAAWNYASLSGLLGFFVGYVALMVPAFLVVAIVATWSRRREAATLATWLPLYAQAGWLADEDVAMITSMARRRQAVGWAKRTYGAAGAKALRDFQHAATELAFLRDRVERGHDVPDFAARERELLARLRQARAAVTHPRSR
ncbi:MAG: protease PrsW [Actinomycetota bacterium]|jgi:RsiW-degrading membrane proteinase PrsW (M82 family)|nr:protease PrsW [Actinomycetota bacterium]